MGLEERFFSKVDALGPCWEWTASTNKAGYGRFRYEGGARLAHHVCHLLMVGPLPEGLEPDHLCRNPPCVNPDHLEWVTHRENMRRSHSTKLLGRMHRSKTECPKGHPYDEKNTLIRPSGWRKCRACDNAEKRARYHRKKERI